MESPRFEIDASSIKRANESLNDPALLSESINEMDSAFIVKFSIHPRHMLNLVYLFLVTIPIDHVS